MPPKPSTSARKRKDSEASSSRYNELSLEQKLLVIKDSEAGISSRKLAEKYSVGKTSILRIIASKSELKEAAENPENLSSKRVKRSTKNDGWQGMRW